MISRSIIQQFVLVLDFHCYSKIADIQFNWTGTFQSFNTLLKYRNTVSLCITSVVTSLHQ